jgi:hypothetical protein
MIDEKTNECDSEKATCIVGWAGKLLKCCDEHAHSLQVLGSVIGSPTEVQRILTIEPCYMASRKDD